MGISCHSPRAMDLWILACPWSCRRVVWCRGSAGDRKVPAVCGVLFICFAAVTWPKAIYVSPTGVRQRGWLGGWRTKPWSQIYEVKEKPDHSIVVRGPKDKI